MKYDIVTDDVKEINGMFLFRVKRCSDGLVGGWIENTSNLSESGSCFVYDNAMVFGNARVEGDAEVRDKSVVCGSAVVKDNCLVMGKSVIQGKTAVCDRATVVNSVVSRRAFVDGDMLITGNDCYEKPSLIKNMFEDDILIYGDVFQIGIQPFDANRLLKNTGYFVKLAKALPIYKNCRIIFTQLIQQHMNKEFNYGQSNF